MDKNFSYSIKYTENELLEKGGFRLAFQQLDQVLLKLGERPDYPDNDILFVSTSIEFARVCFVLGMGFKRLIIYLEKALQAVERTGDLRSKAMLHLHMGRLLYFSEQREKAMKSFSAGKLLVESLGDSDITSQAAELIGLYYFIQGKFKDAQTFFEQATQSYEFGGYGHSGPMWLSYCHAFLGHFNRAIGTVDYYRRLARERGNNPLSTTLRSVLGIFLVRIRKMKEASFHLSGALQDASQEQNIIAEYFARGGLAFYHLNEGRIKDSKEWMASAISFGKDMGLVRQYASPFVLEMIFEYHRNNIAPIKELFFTEEAMRLLQEPNIHLCAVALRLMAIDGLNKGMDLGHVRSMLQQSEQQLKISGDPVQLAKTRLEMARLCLKQRDQKQARLFAQKAWKGFSGYENIFYPDDLRHLLVSREELDPGHEIRESMFQRFSDMIEDLNLSDNLDELLAQTVKATNRFFGAERGGLFLFGSSKKQNSPKLIAGHNLFSSDISKDLFRSSLNLIFKAFHENKTVVKRYRAIETLTGTVRAMIAVPFEIEGETKGILYHDNAYVDDCFDHFNKNELVKMTRYLSKYINSLMVMTRRIEEQTSTNYKRRDEYESHELIAESPVMRKILKQVDRIAKTDSTVLLLGETGVGKEVMAQKIHELSTRRDLALIVVDPTTIPETLFESELFGHEKGAFTGADKQKTGRIELANKGTLFIDEVGEIPLGIQVKLLRALQEKAIMRVGGTQIIKSDFRLIAATNRDLQKEVKQRRFREDLYYRLNVIPLELPPLRKRGEDILLLAQSFIKRYGLKYKHPVLELTPFQKQMLLAYNWPGNIRELKNIIERAVILAEDNQLELQLEKNEKSFDPHDFFKERPSLDEMQRQYINYILEESNDKIGGAGGAAEKLGMKRTSLYARMRTLGMR